MSKLGVYGVCDVNLFQLIVQCKLIEAEKSNGNLLNLHLVF